MPCSPSLATEFLVTMVTLEPINLVQLPVLVEVFFSIEAVPDTAEEGTSEVHLPMNPHGHGLVLSWIVSVHKLHRRVCPSCHNYQGFSAKKNMFLPDIIKDNSDSLEKTRGLDYMGFACLLLKLSLSACSSKIISPASIQPAAARLFRRLQLTVTKKLYLVSGSSEANR